MRAKQKKVKRKPNAKVIAGIVGSVCILGFIGGINGNSEQVETTSSYESLTDFTKYSEETTTEPFVENESTEEITSTAPSTPEVSTSETDVAETSSTAVETTSQVVPETTTEAVTESSTAEQVTTVDAGQELVWVSETGKKYHSKNTCYPINPDNARQVTKEEAVNVLGLEPCGKCYK